MNREYVMGNSCFRVRIQKGVLLWAGPVGETDPTIYINEEKGFGDLLLTWSRNGKSEGWKPFSSEEYKDEAPILQGRDWRYGGRAERDNIRVDNEYVLAGGEIRHNIKVTNTGTQTVRLQDMGLQFSAQTHFEWGRPAGKEVIGHHFVAGTGSHSTYYRCDGKGRLLGVLPCEGSDWIWYDIAEEDGKEVQDVSTVRLYVLNEEAGSKAVQAGSRLRIPAAGRDLKPGEGFTYHEKYLLAEDYEDCRDLLVESGQVVAESIPGYTVPIQTEVLLCLRSRHENLELACDNGEITCIRQEGEQRFYQVRFTGLGEQCLRVKWHGGYVDLYYFVTESVKTLIQKRGAFLADKQIRDESKWYHGLLGEWNSRDGVLLSPDEYDNITNWRIYAVTCDDPGLSRPAFLSSKQTVYPVQREINALDDYIEYFVWGGLQQTEEEPYPYAVYGIPDWHTLRNSGKPGNDGETHIWRIYDYPHIALLYYNMYYVAAHAAEVTTRLDGEAYLMRAYGTALAMFQVPEELEGWSAYKTGLYNELVIPWIINALRKEGHEFQAGRLERFWNRKATYFVKECKDIFGSEYPFDTTGFESTHVLAAKGLKGAVSKRNEDRFSDDISCDMAWEFMVNQTACNIACRGLLEPAYFWYGSDYRGNNMTYTLSYMSQMGGCSLLDYACYYAEKPFELLRLAYGSLLSSWALMNTGTKDSNYGYWFPGIDNDGSAGGGFEPLYMGETWLNQPHTGGAWYYSCEIDLGFCGGVRGAATILAEDPLFGNICYGGQYAETENGCMVHSEDGVGRRFHYLTADKKLHIELLQGQFSEEGGIEIRDTEAGEWNRISCRINTAGYKGEILMKVLFEKTGDYRVEYGRTGNIRGDQPTYIRLPAGKKGLTVDFIKKESDIIEKDVVKII